jgi:hypothetical protein
MTKLLKNLDRIVNRIRTGEIEGASFVINGSSVEHSTGYLTTVACVDVSIFDLTPELVRSLMLGLLHRAIKANTRIDCFGMFSYGDGYVSIDANQHLQQKAPALELAKMNKQVAIWDCRNSVALDVAKEWPAAEQALIRSRLDEARDRQ